MRLIRLITVVVEVVLGSGERGVINGIKMGVVNKSGMWE